MADMNKLINLGNLSRFYDKLKEKFFNKDEVNAALDLKVDKVDGKGLSTDDYVKATVDAQIATAKSEAVSEAGTALDTAKAELNAAIDLKVATTDFTPVKNAVDTLNGEADVDGSVKKQIADAKTELVGGATVSTLKGLEDKLQGAIDGMQWKHSVPTFSDLATTYPNAEEGWTVSVEDTNEIFRYDEESTSWISIAKTLDLSDIEVATADKNGLMSKEHVTSLTAVVAESAQNKADIATANGKITANENAIAVLNGEADGSVKKAVADAKAELEAAIGLKADTTALEAVEAKADANTAAIEVLNGDSATAGSVDAKVKVVDDKVTALSGVVDGKANAVHTHVLADITDVEIATEAEIVALFN